MKMIFAALLAFTAATVQAQTVSLEESQLPQNLSNADLLSLAEGFCADNNAESLNTLVVGIAHQREALLLDVFQEIAQNCPATADSVVYNISQNLPDLGLSSFAMMSSYLSDYDQTNALAALNGTNANLLAQLSGQGLEVETAAGVESNAVDFNAILEAIDVPVDGTAAQ